MLNDLINKNIEDLHHLDNHQRLQGLNLVHQFEIHRYWKCLFEILLVFYHPKQINQGNIISNSNKQNSSLH
jgi:hypothetical protein